MVRQVGKRDLARALVLRSLFYQILRGGTGYVELENTACFRYHEMGEKWRFGGLCANVLFSPMLIFLSTNIATFTLYIRLGSRPVRMEDFGHGKLHFVLARSYPW